MRILSYFELVRGIPGELQGKVADSLVDLILDSSNASKLSGNLARSILRHWQSNQLATESGLATLVEASLQIEPQKTSEAFSGLGMSAIAERLRVKV